VLDVPAELARRVRLLSSGHARKSDEADALPVGVAAHTAPRLHTARTDEAITALRALIEHREDLMRTRTQTANRLHALATKLMPAGLPRKLTAKAADQRISSVADQISAAVAESGTTLTELHGIGDLLAAKIIARTAGIHRFRSSAAFASYCGVAPLEASSGDVKRHRLSRHGDRQLNSALHIMAITQIRHQPRDASSTSGNAPKARATRKPCTA
jgi:transposase